MSESIGFIGLGIMGRGMVDNLLRAGFTLTIWNRTASRMTSFIERGAKAASSPSEVAARSDIIITCVSDTPDVEQVILGEDGVIHGAAAGDLVIDMSTINPVNTVEIARQLNARGVAMLDAPISGGSEGAANGTLSIMIGGGESDVARAMPCFKAMGSTITHVGEQGAGQTVKLSNQILCVVNMLAASEALLFAKAGGVDLEKMLSAVTGGAAGSWMLANRGPQVIDDYWQPGFSIDLQQKDLRLVLGAADELGVPVIATALCFNLYRTLQAQGHGGDGNHSIIRALEAMAGIKARR
ncbi:MAG: NAD(P)-dependent oxidoreductase [Chloroflexi bacterium]|nr:NAD(P)-dependent oxidoreductase [Chloroflexota bacterium]MCY3583545.1 NAD(P)-dependent oxidoreductase [Chloroflexota bacterium]MCY3716148.1 NAD(P)-dependent oxidoreductase [Chloroflexota bacterium]MDE2650966.1 NAD(P)-dependent oxidoreductase [Chloroflexota bacterium]MXV93590.1 NAD(P)-dependent oxidoreductase [Chloroflexota bacterium]